MFIYVMQDIRAITKVGNGSVATGAEDNTVKTWDVQTAKCTKTLTGHSNVSL